MFAKVSPLQLFQTPVFAQDLPDPARRQLEPALLQALAALPAGPPAPLWRSHHDLHRRSPFRPLAGLLLETAQRILAQLKSVQQAPAITALWATREQPGAALPPELQQNAYLAGLYLLEGAAGQVRFLDPRPQAHLIAGPVSQPTPATQPEATLPLRPGRLLLWPAWLWHHTLPNPGPGPRTLVHFALSFQDFARAMSPPRWTGLTPPEPEA